MIKPFFCQENKKKLLNSFTLVEVIAVVAILMILAVISIFVFNAIQREVDLTSSAEEITVVFRTAQNQTLASQEASSYGVYFDTASFPHGYVLFKGSDYSSREAEADKEYRLPRSVEIYQVDLQGSSETAFVRLTGAASHWGSVSLRLRNDTSKSKTIYLQEGGQVYLEGETPVSDDDRIKDSRHVHLFYSRNIDISDESVILTFFYNSSSLVYQIPIADYLSGGQFVWEGQVLIQGQLQKIKIHSHWLNNPDTLFCVHRDRDLNSKALSISLSGDFSGSLIEYSADGLTVDFISIYVSDLTWQ